MMGTLFLILAVAVTACGDGGPAAPAGPATPPDASAAPGPADPGTSPAAGDDAADTRTAPDTSGPASEAAVATSRTRFRDRGTGSLWTLRGEAVSGPLAGRRLRQLPAHRAYWFAWSSFWPGTDVWGQDDGDGAFHVGALDPIEPSEFLPDLPVDAIPPLDDPPAGFGRARFVEAADATLRASDVVVGIHLGHEARAYPVSILNFHEIVNHTVGGVDVIVTYCPLTASGLLFAGGGDTFGNTGGLYLNNMVMYDRTTRSAWSQMGQRAILGERGGERLELLPVTQSTWKAWRELYPETTVLTTNTAYERPYDRDIYIDSGYTTSEEIWFPQSAPVDRRFPAKAMTLGLVGAKGTRAYLFDKLAALGRHAVLEDEFEDEPVLVVYDGPGRLAVPFSRRLDDRVLTFEVVD